MLHLTSIVLFIVSSGMHIMDVGVMIVLVKENAFDNSTVH